MKVSMARTALAALLTLAGTSGVVHAETQPSQGRKTAQELQAKATEARDKRIGKAKEAVEARREMRREAVSNWKSKAQERRSK